MIGRSLGIGMIGSDISCINTNSTQISIARTTVLRHAICVLVAQRCWFQFRKPYKVYQNREQSYSINVILADVKCAINFVRSHELLPNILAILIWFLGTCALPFSFAGPCSTTSCAVTYVRDRGTNRKAVHMHSELVAAHVISRDFAAPWLYLCWTCVTVYKLYWPSETKWQRTGS